MRHPATITIFPVNFITGSINLCTGACCCSHKNDEFVLYHAFHADRDSGFDNFIHLLKSEEINDILIFQKSAARGQSNRMKAPILAINITYEIGIEVKRISVNEYTSIICDAGTNRIYLTSSLYYNQATDTHKIFSEKECTPAKIDLTTFMNTKDSVNEINARQLTENYFPDFNLHKNILLSVKQSNKRPGIGS
jgi:hypothetical protein